MDCFQENLAIGTTDPGIYSETWSYLINCKLALLVGIGLARVTSVKSADSIVVSDTKTHRSDPRYIGRIVG